MLLQAFPQPGVDEQGVVHGVVSIQCAHDGAEKQGLLRRKVIPRDGPPERGISGPPSNFNDYKHGK
jgi:hypothetical protein